MKKIIFKKGITRRLFSIALALAMVFTILPMNNMKVYAWAVSNVNISNITYDGECITSMKVAYSYPYESNSWPQCTCYVGIQEVPGNKTAVMKTDYASMHKPTKEATVSDTSANSLMKTLKIVAFNAGDGIRSFGGYRDVSATVTMPAATELQPGKTYYMYIWTYRNGGSCTSSSCHQPDASYSSDFYIDAYLGELSLGIDGYVTFKYPNGTTQGFGQHKNHSLEYSVVDNQLIAKCKGAAGGCTFSTCHYNTDETAVRLNLTANSPVTYTGGNVVASYGPGEAEAWKTAFGTDAPIIKYEYKASADGTYAATTETKNAGYYRASVTAGGKTVYKEFQITKATLAAPAAGVGCTINYTNETITANNGYEISASDTSVSAPAGGKITPGATYYVRKKGDSNNNPSAWTAITIPARPATPSGLTASAVTAIGAKDGTISGVNKTMEYSTDGGKTWTKVKGTEITGLGAGDVRVRVAATASSCASDVVTVSVPDHVHTYGSKAESRYTCDCGYVDTIRKDEAEAADHLKAAKKAAKKAIDAEVDGDTTPEVVAAAEKAKEKIDAATELTEVSDVELGAIAKIAKIKHLNKLEEVKRIAKAEIDNEVGADTSINVKRAAEDAKAAIDAATSVKDVETVTDKGIEAIEAAKAANKALTEAKEAAKAAIDEEVDGDTTPEVVAAAKAAKKAIDAATTLTEVSDAELDGIAKIAKLRHLNKLEEVKKIAKREIDNEIGTDASANVKKAAEAAKKAIDAATALEDVKTATDKGIEAIEEAKETNKKVEAAKEAAKAAIDAEVDGDTTPKVVAAAEAAKAAIDAATTLTEISDAELDGIAKIAKLRHLNKLEEVKKAAKREIDNEVGIDASTNVKKAAEDAKAAIDAAKTVADVEAATDKGIEAIEAAKKANKGVPAAIETAKAEIDAAVGTDTAANVKKAADDAKKAIEAATTMEEVEAAKENGLKAINAAKEANAGKIHNTTNPQENFGGANVELERTEIIEKFELTEEELARVEKGEDIAVKLEVEPQEAKNVSAAEKIAAETKLAKGEKIGQYLDINLFKIVGNDKSKVTNTNGTITIEITIPSELRKVGKDFFIIRVHDGVATRLELTHVSGDTYSFETDRFSTYAIGYKEIDNSSANKVVVTAPKTADTNDFGAWGFVLLFAALGGMFAFVGYNKRKELF